MAHGRIVVNEQRCKGCELCTTACPPDILAMAERLNAQGYHPVYLVNEVACTGCGLCAVICPDAAITVYRLTAPSHSPTSLAV